MQFLRPFKFDEKLKYQFNFDTKIFYKIIFLKRKYNIN